ncbi:hypothetical protein [Curtobacterium sp. MCBD17_032]|uniref:hypothetical protein n=1 Tax=Curtobacterium sp. MCBD17_032 TaxID=2175659 RepID=UPI000DA819D8|nr:hypothetical protein [Curtobacterium sp. MCBD17_032]PZE86219.1 hypothetical protein DEI91_03685 [Curtobacterium sp. MCBD17_032]
MRIDARVVLALLLVPTLLTGCSSAPHDDTRPPISDSPSPSAASAAEVGACMRDRGHDVDDSQFAESGGSRAQVSVPEGVDPDRWVADLDACSGGAADAPAAEPVPGWDALTRKAAACIRDGGFPDYPDGMEDQRRWKPSDTDAFDRVAQECDAKVFGAVGTEAGR